MEGVRVGWKVAVGSDGAVACHWLRARPWRYRQRGLQGHAELEQLEEAGALARRLLRHAHLVGL